MTRLEICLSTFADVSTAQAAGADRVELCARLEDGGTTPEAAVVQELLDSNLSVNLQLMIRPRGGDFVWSSTELTTMLGHRGPPEPRRTCQATGGVRHRRAHSHRHGRRADHPPAHRRLRPRAGDIPQGD